MLTSLVVSKPLSNLDANRRFAPGSQGIDAFRLLQLTSLRTCVLETNIRRY